MMMRRAFLRQEKVAKGRFYRNRSCPTVINRQLKIKVKASGRSDKGWVRRGQGEPLD